MKSEMYGRWIQDMYGEIYCHPGVVGRWKGHEDLSLSVNSNDAGDEVR